MEDPFVALSSRFVGCSGGDMERKKGGGGKGKVWVGGREGRGGSKKKKLEKLAEKL